jgi:hypothetical protein
MHLYKYTISSLQIFIISFMMGHLINKFFTKLQIQYNIPPLTAGFAQLFSIIFITYFIFKYQIYFNLFEQFSPHFIFSSFLFSLQTNMINNFKQYI